MHRWENVPPDEMPRTARTDWGSVGWWAAAFAWSALWWAVMVAALVVGLNR